MIDEHAETTRQTARDAKPAAAADGPAPREDQRRPGRKDRREAVRLGGRRPGEE
jgi:hypothetical protein